MVGNEEKRNHKNGISNGLVKNIVLNTIENGANITDLDLSNRQISSFDENLELPPSIVHLKLANNRLTEVPRNVLKLEKLTTLDLSFNSIVFFDDAPSFCHTIEKLNLSHNALKGLPCWVWSENPSKLVYLNISNNRNICTTFTSSYIDEILKYKTLVKEIDIHNCQVSKYVKFMATFCHAKVVTLGSEEYSHLYANHLDHLPCAGLEDCVEIETMNVSNTQIYHINSNIDIYKNLKELNLSQNNLNSLPNEFCNLLNLESCKLSSNMLLYLPDDVCKLTKLVKLYLDNNKLCMLPDTFHELQCLKTLDLYNNNLYEALDSIDKLEEVDFAQNYFEEPDDEEYLVKKGMLRINYMDREDGRKPEMARDDCETSRDSEDDDELYALVENQSDEVTEQEAPNTRSSTPEDWDSDDYWIPQYYKRVTPPRSPWLFFVKKKMEEGNFCPMDVHAISIADQVKYEKYCNPPVVHEIDGQFDDYSDDDS